MFDFFDGRSPVSMSDIFKPIGHPNTNTRTFLLKLYSQCFWKFVLISFQYKKRKEKYTLNLIVLQNLL